MRFKIEPEAKRGDTRTIKRLAIFPKKVAVVDDNKDPATTSFIRVWFERYYVDQQYKLCKFRNESPDGVIGQWEDEVWVNIGFGYVYRNRKVV
jgi:hypothetical protein